MQLHIQQGCLQCHAWQEQDYFLSPTASFTKLNGDFHSHTKAAKFPVPQLRGTMLLEQLLIQKCPADAQNCSLTALVLCLCRAGGVSLHTLKERGDKSSTIQWHLDATGFWLISIHTKTKPLLHVLRVVTPIQGNFSTQILASKTSFGFAEITRLNYVLFSGRKKNTNLGCLTVLH